MSKRKASWWISLFIIGVISLVFCSSNHPAISSPSSLGVEAANFSQTKTSISLLDEAKSFSVSTPSLLTGNSFKGLSSPGEGSQSFASLGNYDYEHQTRSYQVQEGDTLSSIAQQFKISVETLCWANDLSPQAHLRPGQKLNILPVSGVLYLVRPGDTLSQIARVHQAKTNEILAFNNLDDPKMLSVGDLLIIPGGKKPKYAPKLTPVASSYFIFPTTGIITQGLHPFNAIDVANKCGTPIYAAAAGVVQKAGYIPIGGNRVRIIHSNGVVTYYGHLSKILVVPGERVAQGQEIGLMGRTGHATGCHVHFDVRGAVNPLAKYPVGTRLHY